MKTRWRSYFAAPQARSEHLSPEYRRRLTPHPIYYMHLALVHYWHRSQLVLVPHSSRNDSIAISLTPRLYYPDPSSPGRALDKPSMDELKSILIKTRSLMMAVRLVGGELALRLCWKRLVETFLGMERSTSKVKERKPEVERAMINWRYYDVSLRALASTPSCNAILFHLYYAM